MSQAETVSCTSGETNNSTHRLKSSPQDISLSPSLPLARSYTLQSCWVVERSSNLALLWQLVQAKSISLLPLVDWLETDDDAISGVQKERHIGLSESQSFLVTFSSIRW